MFEVDVIESVFVGTPDLCERLVAAMQYCAFIPDEPSFSNAVIVTLLEKGVLYKEMIDLSDFSLVDQCFYISQKFSEFGERLEIVDAQIAISKESLEELLLAMISRVKTNFESRLLRSSMFSHSSQVKVIIIRESVYIINMKWTDIRRFVQEITNILHNSLLQAPYTADIVCIIKERAGLEDHRASYEDQLIAFHDFLKESKKEEAKGNVIDIRASIKGQYHSQQVKQAQDTDTDLSRTIGKPYNHNTPHAATTAAAKEEYQQQLEDVLDSSTTIFRFPISQTRRHDEDEHDDVMLQMSQSLSLSLSEGLYHGGGFEERSNVVMVVDRLDRMDEHEDEQDDDQSEAQAVQVLNADHDISFTRDEDKHAASPPLQPHDDYKSSPSHDTKDSSSAAAVTSAASPIIAAVDLDTWQASSHHHTISSVADAKEAHSPMPHYHYQTSSKQQESEPQQPQVLGGGELTSSLQQNLINHSEDNENMLTYVTRAYHMIRDHAVEATPAEDLLLRQSVLTMSSRPSTAVAVEGQGRDLGEELRKLEEKLDRMSYHHHSDSDEKEEDQAQILDEDEDDDYVVGGKESDEAKYDSRRLTASVVSSNRGRSPYIIDKQEDDLVLRSTPFRDGGDHDDYKADTYTHTLTHHLAEAKEQDTHTYRYSSPTHHDIQHQTEKEEEQHPEINDEHQEEELASFAFRSELDTNTHTHSQPVTTSQLKTDYALDLASLKASGIHGLSNNIKHTILLEKMKMIYDDYQHIERQEQLKKNIARVRVGSQVFAMLQKAELEADRMSSNNSVVSHKTHHSTAIANTTANKTTSSKIAKIVRPSVTSSGTAVAAPPPVPPPRNFSLTVTSSKMSSAGSTMTSVTGHSSPSAANRQSLQLPRVPSPHHKASPMTKCSPMKASPASKQAQQQPAAIDPNKKAAVVWSIGDDDNDTKASKPRPRSVPRLSQPRSSMMIAQPQYNEHSEQQLTVSTARVPPMSRIPGHSRQQLRPVADAIAVISSRRESDEHDQSYLQPHQPVTVSKPRSMSAGPTAAANNRRPNTTTAAPAAGGGRVQSSLSNVQQTRNALSAVCLAGGHQEQRRLEVLDLIDYYAVGRIGTSLPVLSSETVVFEALRGNIAQFVLMFYKTKSLAFKGIYVADQRSSQSLVRIYGKGPARLAAGPGDDGIGAGSGVKEFLKFETSSKSFKSLPVKTVTSTVDGIILEAPKMRTAV